MDKHAISRYVNILTIIIIFSMSFFLRTYWNIDYVGDDEGFYVGFAHDIIQHSAKSLSSAITFQLSSCAICFWEPYFLVPFMLVFGFVEHSLHIFSAFIGSLGVLAVYLIGKKYFNYWIGVTAAFLLMFNETHWYFSGFAQMDVPGTLFSILAVYFLWTGYKEKSLKKFILGSFLTFVAEGIKYSFFPAASMFIYLFLFERKSLKNRKLLFFIFLPMVLYGTYLVYHYSTDAYDWNVRVVDHVFLKVVDIQPFYYFFEQTYSQYLLPPLTFFVLSVSLFLLLKRYEILKKRFDQYLFLIFFFLCFLLSQVLELSPFIKAVFGFSSLFLLCLYYFKFGGGFSKLLVIYVASIFIFFSLLPLKYDRYMALALPALFILIAQLIFEMRKNRFFFATILIVLLLYSFISFIITGDRFLTEEQWEEQIVKAQQYVKDNSQVCSYVFSPRPSSFFYIRERRYKLPWNFQDFVDIIKSSCECPPRYVFSDYGGFFRVDYLTSDIVEHKVDYFSPYYYNMFKNGGNYIATSIYQIKDDFISQVCKK